MTMNEFKPTATAYFNAVIPAEELQAYFSNAWDGWAIMECRYTPDTTAYKTVIDRYVDKLNAAYGYNIAVGKDETSTTTDTTKKTGTDTTDRENATTTNGGERGGNNYTYPTGYTEEPDTAYIAARTTEDAYIDSTSGTGTDTVTHNTTDEHTGVTVDNLARAAALDPAKAEQAHKIIRECVFAFVANVYEGVL